MSGASRAALHGIKLQQGSKPPPPPEEEDSLYNTGADFEFDAVTITALLGAAVAFQFFVLANL